MLNFVWTKDASGKAAGWLKRTTTPTPMVASLFLVRLTSPTRGRYSVQPLTALSAAAASERPQEASDPLQLSAVHNASQSPA